MEEEKVIRCPKCGSSNVVESKKRKRKTKLCICQDCGATFVPGQTGLLHFIKQ